MNDSVILAKDLTKRFGQVLAVNKLNLDIKRGEIFGFLGPNGAGKSTTIRMLCGILLPSSGNAWVNRYSVIDEPEMIKRNIGYMSQQFGLYNDLTVEENIEFFARVYIDSYHKAIKARDKIIDEMGLQRLRKVLTAELSGGWKQRVALACAVVHGPDIVFLDEPTAGIDPVARRKLWDILYRFSSEGMTLFVTTHYMEEAERCHRIGFIWNGNLVACDSPEGVKKKFINEKIVSISGSPIMKIVELANSLDYVVDANIYGSEAHIVVAKNESEERLRDYLMASGVRVDEMRIITPSIEDVFVALSRD